MKKGVILGVIISVVFLSFVLASHSAFNSADFGTLFSYGEDTVNIYNISINNSDPGQVANITEINITLQSGLTFGAGSEGISDGNSNFTATSAGVLSWGNFTDGYVVNGSNVSTIVFNLTASVPGHYTINISTQNSTNVSTTSMTIEINDTTTPSSIEFVAPAINGSGYALNNLEFNVSAVDNYNISAITLYVMVNSTYTIINKTSSGINVSAYYFNFTNYSDGMYLINASVNDSANNVNVSSIWTVYLDNAAPNDITFVSPTSANLTALSQDSLEINVTFSDSVLVNTVMIEVFNTTNDRVNATVTTTNATSFYLNFTNYIDGTYTINASVNDTAGNVNSTTTMVRTIYLDNSAPGDITFQSPTPGNATGASDANIEVNVSFADSMVVSTVWIEVFQSNFSRLNATVTTTNATAYYLNFTNLSDGTYYINVSVNDTAGNVNSTGVRTVYLDNAAPNDITFVSPTSTNATVLSQDSLQVNVSFADSIIVNTVWIEVFNTTNDRINNSITTTNATAFYLNFTNYIDGTYIINVSVNDTAGNVNSTSSIRTIYLDNTVPSDITFVSPMVVNATGASDANIEVNVSFADSMVVSTVWIEVFQSNFSRLNATVTTTNATAYYLNFTNLSDGTYYINVSVNDTAGNVNSTGVRTVYLDNAAPNTIEFVNATPINGANLSRSDILFNVTFSDSIVIDTILLEVFNSTGRWNVSASTNASSYYVNFSYLSNGAYKINATINDTAGNVNSTVVTRLIRLDTVVPVVALASTSSTGSSITVAVTNSDTGGSGVLSTCTATPQGGIAGTKTSQTLTDTGLSCADSYYYTVTCTDRAGNIGRASNSFSTSSCGGNSFAVGGGGGGSSTTTTTTEDETTEEDTTMGGGEDGSAMLSPEETLEGEGAGELGGGSAASKSRVKIIAIVVLIILILVLIVWLLKNRK